MADFRLSSPAFAHDEDLPARHTPEGGDVSPPLAWTDPPEGTKELVLIAEDPDADAGVFTHWIVYGILPDARSLPEGLPDDAIVENADVSVVQGLNEFDELGYSGPVTDEDRGPHRMFFRLFALDTELDSLPAGATRAELRKAAKDHILAVAELVGIA